MQHIVYSEEIEYPVALLIKQSAFKSNELEGVFTVDLEKAGIPRKDLVFLSLPYNEKGKAPVSFIKQQLETIMVGLSDMGTNYIYCADAAYFKVLTGKTKAEQHLGYSLPCVIKGFEHMQVMLGVNHRSLMYNPNNEGKLKLSIDTLISKVNGCAAVLGSNIVHSAEYPFTVEDIEKQLVTLHNHPKLVCDIETFSLRHDGAGIGTIGFSWDQHNGIAFACDYEPLEKPEDKMYGRFVVNTAVRDLLRTFFEDYKGSLTFHGSGFDIKMLIAALWMEDMLDTNGLLKGLDILTRDFHDTKQMAYLVLNSTARNSLGLKDLAHEFAGNWAQEEIKDIRKIPLPQLLKYNLVDCLSTYYVMNKYYPLMVEEEQEDFYKAMALPSQKAIIQIELTGMPLCPAKVADARKQLEAIASTHKAIIEASPTVHRFNAIFQQRSMEAANAKLKVKQHPIEAFSHKVLNPASPNQLQVLLYEVMGLPIVDRTKTKQPATGAKTIKKLINHTKDQEYIDTLNALMGFSKADKILNTFIPAFENAIDKGTSVVWLHGSFNVGGTVSGRLSSSDPNLQNLPSGSKYGKLVKGCFVSPEGWIFSGADFHSLEDYISALTTRDPNKLKVYLDKYDGHCLRAFSYFPERLPDIRQATEEDKCFTLTMGDVTHYIKGTDTLVLSSGEKVLASTYASGI